jgi:hypothetical protein
MEYLGIYHLLKWNPIIIQVGMEFQNHLLKWDLRIQS